MPVSCTESGPAPSKERGSGGSARRNPSTGLGRLALKNPFSLSTAERTCPGRDLNPHGLIGHRILSPACLPVPPPGQQKKIPRSWQLRDVQSGKRGSNSRPQPWQGCALPAELLPQNRIAKVCINFDIAKEIEKKPWCKNYFKLFNYLFINSIWCSCSSIAYTATRPCRTGINAGLGKTFSCVLPQ